MDFFRPVKEELIWVDNKSAIAIAKQTEVRAKCRHFQLRYHRVKDEARKLQFVPTHLQKADPLTKQTSKQQRQLLFHHTYNDQKVDETEEDYDLEHEDVGTQWFVACIPSFRGGEC